MPRRATIYSNLWGKAAFLMLRAMHESDRLGRIHQAIAIFTRFRPYRPTHGTLQFSDSSQQIKFREGHRRELRKAGVHYSTYQHVRGVIATLPEPGTDALLLTEFLGLAVARRRNQS